MTAWPDLGANSPARLEAEPVGWSALSDRLVARTGGAVPFDAPRPETASPPPPSTRRRLWPLAAFFLSAVVHAAVVLFVAERLSRAGMEAETDAISVEIVIEPAPAAEPAVAGNAGETQAATAEQPDTVADEAQEPTGIEADTETEDAKVAEEEAEEEVDPAEAPAVVLDTPFSPLPDMPPDLATAAAAPAEAVAQPETEILTADPFRAELATPPVIPMPPEIILPPLDEKAMAILVSPPEVPEARQEAKEQPASTEKKAVPETRTRREPRERQEPPVERKRETAKAEAPKTIAPARKTDKAERKADKAEAASNQPTAKAPGKRQKASVAGNAAKSAASAGGEARYARKIAGHIQRFKRYPKEAQRNGVKGAVRVSITIDRSGGLSAARVSGSSGHAVLDKEAIATARRAAPYPRAPDGVGGRTLNFSFTLRFSG